jgi:hypothetical protein
VDIDFGEEPGCVAVWSEQLNDGLEVECLILPVNRGVGNCASGRLVARAQSTHEDVEPHLQVSIGLVEDPAQGCSGPLWLRGRIPVTASDGFQYEVRNRVTLCRCGQSKNKPFCDGTHVANKFKDE